jgi:hypothetical protein
MKASSRLEQEQQGQHSKQAHVRGKSGQRKKMKEKYGD